MKDISLRPKQQLMNLFEAVQKMENLPKTDRNSIVDHAMKVALTSNNVDWQAVSEISIGETFKDAIPAHIVLKVDEKRFLQIKAQIKTTFGTEKITIPYTLKLLLTLYLVYLKQQTNVASQREHLGELLTADLKMNTLLLKSEYEQSIYSGKKRLFNVCQVFLKQYPIIYEQLLRQSKEDLKICRMFTDLNKYFDQEATETSPTPMYLGKVMAGLIILRIESTTHPNGMKAALDHVVKKMEAELQTIGHAIDHEEAISYYKNIYAKMMGGRI
ncbi:MAG: hypothetical protein FWG67_09860 [Defluviitaleaceae bacterium]|nr:hypothetical protein [Defluviitaleaceae bacterium]